MKNLLLVALFTTALFSCKKGETHRCDVKVSDTYTRTILSDADQPQSGLANTEAYINNVYPGKPYSCQEITRKEYKKLQEEFDNKAKNP